MIFERFEEKGLAHYSYAVGCRSAGRLIIIDPKRDVDTYIQFAEERRLQISRVLETHIHADFASGARQLAHQTGAEVCVSGYDQGEVFEVAFEHRDLHEGDNFEVGSVRIEVIHTPGHTPEHVSYLVFDQARSASVPLLMLSGDFLFVGSVGRPDLLGEEAKLGLASRMVESVRKKLSPLPDGLEIHPAHGAGSMCGVGISGRPTSTLGFERMTNPYLNEKLSREGFVEQLLATVPPFPEYYQRMKKVNSEGPILFSSIPGSHPVPAQQFKELIDEGAVVIDLRDQLSFGGGHVPAAYGIPFGWGLSTWASWVVPYDAPLLLCADPNQVEPAARALIRVGLDDIVGYLKGGMKAWREAGFELATTPQISVGQLSEQLAKGADLHVIDVRTRKEWDSGHVEGAVHLMAGHLPKQLDQLPDGDLALICDTGFRSTVAASVLQRAGFQEVMNVTGGMKAWEKAGLPVTRRAG